MNAVQFLEEIGSRPNLSWGASKVQLMTSFAIPREQREAILRGDEISLRGSLSAPEVIRCLIIAPD